MTLNIYFCLHHFLFFCSIKAVQVLFDYGIIPNFPFSGDRSSILHVEPDLLLATSMVTKAKYLIGISLN